MSTNEPTPPFTAAEMDAAEVVAEISRLKGDARYFVFVIGSNLIGQILPQEPMYEFLKSIGSGRQLAKLEQIVSQLGTGLIQKFSYILAATTQEGDLPGFEEYSAVGYTTLAMQFLPVKIDGKIIYAPVQQ